MKLKCGRFARAGGTMLVALGMGGAAMSVGAQSVNPGAAVGAATAVVAQASAPMEPGRVFEERSHTMKGLGKAMRALRGFIREGDLAIPPTPPPPQAKNDDKNTSTTKAAPAGDDPMQEMPLNTAPEAVAALAAAAPRIIDLFPPDTGIGANPDSEAKDIIWERWDEFVAASESFSEKVAALEAALASTGPSRADHVGAAYGALGKEGCGGCHRVFRQKR